MGTEAFTCVLFVAAMGRRVLDSRLLSTVARLFGVCAAVMLLDRICAQLGPARLMLDAAAYCALAVACGAVRIAEIREFAANAMKVKQLT